MIRVFLNQRLKRVNAAQPNEKVFIPKHLGGLLVALIEQTLLGCLCLPRCHEASPYGKQDRDDTTDHESQVADRRADGVLAPL